MSVPGGETVVAASSRGVEEPESVPPGSHATPHAVSSTQNKEPTNSRTPAHGSRRLVFTTPISTPTHLGGSSLRKNPRTPGSGVKVGNGEEMCAVCFSPLQRNGGKGVSRWDFFGEALEKEELRARGDDGGKGEGPIVTRNGQTRRETENEHLREKERVADPKRELFTTACNHVFHKCCLVECRVRDFSTCPMCRAALPAGLTPEHVREKNAAKRLLDQANAQHIAIVSATARAREAVRAQYVRRMINRPVNTSVFPNVPPAIEEESGGSGGTPEASARLGAMPPWMSPPRRRAVGGSAPATPARTISLPVDANSVVTSPFVTAAEELRQRAESSNVAALAFATASAPSTPARTLSLADELTDSNHYPATGTISSLMRDAQRGPGNAGTLDGLVLAERDAAEARGRDASLIDSTTTTVASVAAALGALGDFEDTRGRDGRTGYSSYEEMDVATNSFEGARRPPLFQHAAAATHSAFVSTNAARDALVARGTASAPATPQCHRPAVAAAMAAAEAAVLEGDERGGERARRVMRRLANE